ncbi:MAG: hypothetical protein JSV86_10660 [Gemmatimonadota bacterium]|nr:MAG: hypothetical protein JSV86_10660 [Gemmatimonadota bacterium]
MAQSIKFKKRPFTLTRKGHPGQCAMTFEAGKYVGPGSGPYRICLSENQAMELFDVPYVPPALANVPKGRGGIKLGCGSWACVWSVGNKAVKITRDVDDIAAFQAAGVVKGVRVPGGKAPGVVTVYKQRELVGAGRDIKTGKPVKLWAQVAQEVGALPKRHEQWIKDRLCRMRVSLLTDVARHRSEKLPNKTFKPSALTRKKVDTSCGALADPREVNECRRLGKMMINTFSDLYRRGVYWVDMNENNLGYDSKTRKWYGFDLGISDVTLADRPQELHGAARKLSRRRCRRK